MSTEPFQITIEPNKRLMRITMQGHWTVETVEAYRHAVIEAGTKMATLGCPVDEILALVDARAGGPQSQEVVAAWRDRIEAHGLAAPRRLASLVSSALLKRQMERIAVPNQRLFTEETEALAWLLSPADAA
ncbi:hypothetical protein [uncultured Sphingomonas sp.]|uniref:hypothetical protein n=1 Tax=uncultured Sphingomonas sp. TaxID=158754 RepID=UPI0035CA74BC